MTKHCSTNKNSSKEYWLTQRQLPLLSTDQVKLSCKSLLHVLRAEQVLLTFLCQIVEFFAWAGAVVDILEPEARVPDSSRGWNGEVGKTKVVSIFIVRNDRTVTSWNLHSLNVKNVENYLAMQHFLPDTCAGECLPWTRWQGWCQLSGLLADKPGNKSISDIFQNLPTFLPSTCPSLGFLKDVEAEEYSRHTPLCE